MASIAEIKTALLVRTISHRRAPPSDGRRGRSIAHSSSAMAVIRPATARLIEPMRESSDNLSRDVTRTWPQKRALARSAYRFYALSSRLCRSCRLAVIVPFEPHDRRSIDRLGKLVAHD